jgi:hypothetical protein
VKDLLTHTTRVLNRRNFLRGATTTAFGTMAAVSVGRTSVAVAAPCTGPGGSGACGCTCHGSTCGSCGSYHCHSVAAQFCGGVCWASGKGHCCDCQCHEGTSAADQWYCYCFG